MSGGCAKVARMAKHDEARLIFHADGRIEAEMPEIDQRAKYLPSHVATARALLWAAENPPVLDWVVQEMLAYCRQRHAPH